MRTNVQAPKTFLSEKVSALQHLLIKTDKNKCNTKLEQVWRPQLKN